LSFWVLFGYETSFCWWMCGYQQDTPKGEVIVQISTCVEKLPIRTKATTVLPSDTYWEN
jgi:hypothetical protein